LDRGAMFCNMFINWADMKGNWLSLSVGEAVLIQEEDAKCYKMELNWRMWIGKAVCVVG
jgi:hypothetical protein